MHIILLLCHVLFYKYFKYQNTLLLLFFINLLKKLKNVLKVRLSSIYLLFQVLFMTLFKSRFPSDIIFYLLEEVPFYIPCAYHWQWIILALLVWKCFILLWHLKHTFIDLRIICWACFLSVQNSVSLFCGLTEICYF